MTNVFELAFGLDPTSGTLGPVRVLSGGTIAPGVPQVDTAFPSGERLAIFGRRKDYLSLGLTYNVLFSADLVSYTPNISTPAVIADDGVMQVVIVPFLPGARFFRVQVTEP